MQAGSFDASKLAADLTARLLASSLGFLTSITKNFFGKMAVDAEIGVNSYLIDAISKISSVKTLLSADEAVNIYEFYVPPNFEVGKQKVGHLELCDVHGTTATRTLITGSGGTGKSIFSRHMFLELCKRKKNVKLPIFFELKQMNGITSDDLLTNMYYTNEPLKRVFSFEQFEYAVSKGYVTFVLDGFDEIDNAKRRSVESEILKIAEKYVDVPIMVSGRPDTAFLSWQPFKNHKISPFTKEQCIECIQKIDFSQTPSNIDAKKRFLKDVKEKLYDSHQTFLSTPLLISMMLIVYAKTADIPMRLTNFYSRAFHTLFYLHDASKGQFRRDTKSKLAEDAFQDFVSCVCALSYLSAKNNNFIFTKEEMLGYIRGASDIVKTPIDPDFFLHDLVECVCLLQYEGGDLSFTHRSFQEYFCAVFMLKNPKFDLLAGIDVVVDRGTESVLQNMFELNSDVLEQKWIIPKLDTMMTDLIKFDDDILMNFMNYLYENMILLRMDKRSHVYIGNSSKIGRTRDAIFNLYGKTPAVVFETYMKRSAMKAFADACAKDGRLGETAKFIARIKPIPADFEFIANEQLDARLKSDFATLAELRAVVKQKSLFTQDKINELFSLK